MAGSKIEWRDKGALYDSVDELFGDWQEVYATEGLDDRAVDRLRMVLRSTMIPRSASHSATSALLKR
jgi:hypothetical protein